MNFRHLRIISPLVEQSAAIKYCTMMEDVKRRTAVADAFIRGTATAVYRATNVESTYLQFRKIMELIAFGSLVAHREAFSSVYAEFARCWNARQLVKDLERVNPGFYPQPIIEGFDEKQGMRTWDNKRDGFLTQGDLILLYKECGGILHERNPYSEPISYEEYEAKAPEWRDKIIGLLNCHLIRLLGDPNVYLVHMEEKHDGRVHHYVFAPTDAPKRPAQ